MVNYSIAILTLKSPPCQPYTRQGTQKGSKDQRAKSFLHLIDILPQLQKQPDFILIENVKGFEVFIFFLSSNSNSNQIQEIFYLLNYQNAITPFKRFHFL